MRQIAIGAVTAVLAVGCASTQVPAEPKSIEATEARVAACEFLGTVSKIAKAWGDRQDRLNKAIRKIAAETDARGGTHFTITRIGEAGLSGEAVGRAYRCETG